MCGLLGIMGRGILQRDREIFRDLLIISQFRGLHSTGVVAATYNYDSTIPPKFRMDKKALSSGEWLVDQATLPKHDQILEWTIGDVFMGHVRWATKGAVNDDNAHPFAQKSFIGAHNGTLVTKKYQPTDKGTDSELFFQDIEERGLTEVLSDLSVADAYAIEMLSREKQELTLARNEQRTLYVAVHTQRDVIYWASEGDFLRFVFKKHNVTDYRIFKLLPNKIYRIKLGNIRKDKEPWEVENLPEKKHYSMMSVWGDYDDGVDYVAANSSGNTGVGKEGKEEGDNEPPFDATGSWNPPNRDETNVKAKKIFGEKEPSNDSKDGKEKSSTESDFTYRCELCQTDKVDLCDERCDTAIVGGERRFIIACVDCTNLLHSHSSSLHYAYRDWDHTMKKIGMVNLTN